MKMNNSAGFTLVEMLIAMAVFAVLMGAVTSLYVAYSHTATVQEITAEAQQSVRVAIELMTQDIRMAGYDPADAGNAGIELAGASKIVVTADRNYDRVNNSSGSIDNKDFERISYELNRNSLRRILYEGTPSKNIQPLIDNVSRLEFSYSGNNNCNVGVLLEVTESVAQAEPIVRMLETQIYCRNLDM